LGAGIDKNRPLDNYFFPYFIQECIKLGHPLALPQDDVVRLEGPARFGEAFGRWIELCTPPFPPAGTRTALFGPDILVQSVYELDLAMFGAVYYKLSS
jgi:hypothetical protein